MVVMFLLFAQAASEYGALVNLGADLNRTFAAVRVWLRTGGTDVWLVVGGLALLLVLLLRRRS